MNLIYFLLIGALAGWLAGQLMKGRGFGLIGNIIVGIVGSMIGGYLSSALNFSLGGGDLGALLIAVLGAVVLLFTVGLIKKA